LRGAALAALAALVGVALAACCRPVATARTTPVEPPAPRELDAAARHRARACSPALGWLWPGLAQACLGQGAEAAALGGLAAAEAGAAIATYVATDDGEHPGVALPLVALQDLWVYGLAAAAIDEDLAAHAPYAPRDTTADLVAAPWNLAVLRRPAVWAGTLGLLAVGIGASLLVDESADAARAGDDPDVFGRRFDAPVGYPLGFGVGVGLFAHVAAAEEALFRGVLQSRFARHAGETQGWVGASLLFGLAHAPNALLLPAEQRRDYLLIGLPVITAAGAYLGWVYRDGAYGLAAPVAIHFWYDLLLTTTFFVLDPEAAPWSAGVTIPF
jgi:membrane protease YdiL (CAAX protease family)